MTLMDALEVAVLLKHARNWHTRETGPEGGCSVLCRGCAVGRYVRDHLKVDPDAAPVRQVLDTVSSRLDALDRVERLQQQWLTRGGCREDGEVLGRVLAGASDGSLS